MFVCSDVVRVGVGKADPSWAGRYSVADVAAVVVAGAGAGAVAVGT